MASVNELLEQALGLPAGSATESTSKYAEVQAAADARLTAMGGMPTPQTIHNAAITRLSGAGLDSSNGIERELATLSYDQIRERYGDANGNAIIDQMRETGRGYENLMSGMRSFGGAASDLVSGAGLGLTNSVGGILALGAGLLSSEAGASVSGVLQDINKAVQDTQSPTLRNHKDAQALRAPLLARDSEAKYNADVERVGPTVARLARIGRDFATHLGDTGSDGVLASDLLGQAIGSLAAGGPAARIAGTAGRALNLVTPNVVTQAVANTAARLPSAVVPGRMAGGIGLMEAGGAYTGAVNEIMNMNHDQLMANSSYYRDLIAQDVPRIEAKQRAASHAGEVAATIAGPLGLAAGKLVDRFEANPLRATSAAGAVRNIGKEGVEETFQGITGQFGQNVGVQAYGDQNRQLDAGLGEQAALGLLGGLTATGAVQSPAVAAHTAARAVGAAVNSTLGAAADMAGRVDAKNEAESPVNNANVSTASTAVSEAAPTVAADMRAAVNASTAPEAAKTKANEAIDHMLSMTSIGSDNVLLSQLPEAVRARVGDSTNTFEVLQKLAETVADDKLTEVERLNAARALDLFNSELRRTAVNNKDILATLPADHAAHQFVDSLRSLAQMITSNPSIVGGIKAARVLMDNTQTEPVKPVEEAKLTTPEGQDHLKQVSMMATTDPENLTKEAIQQVLMMATQGKLKLTQAQHQSLLAAEALVSAREKAITKAGLNPRAERVARQVTSNIDSDNAPLSAKGFALGIVDALRSGDVAQAKKLTHNFGQLVRHFQNKVTATNANYAKPDSMPTVRALDSGSRTWYDNKKPFKVHAHNENSVNMAQQMAAEAQFLTDVYNNMLKAFPQLGTKQAKHVPLHPNLLGNPKEVAAKHSKPAETTTPTPAESAEPTLSPMDRFFPNLLGAKQKIVNFFKTSFSFPEEQKSRSLEFDNLVGTLKDALVSPQKFKQFSRLNRAGSIKGETRQAYLAVLNKVVPDLMARMNNSLLAYFKADGGKVYKQLMNGDQVTSWSQARATNIVDIVDGKPVYNEKLLQAAVLAGFQYLLSQGNSRSFLEAKDVAKILDIDEELITQADIDYFNSGSMLVSFERALASKIVSFWGLDPDPNSRDGFVKGIPEAVAKELTLAMEAAGLIILNQSDEDNVRRPILITRNDQFFTVDNPLNEWPNLLEETLLVEPEQVFHIGSPPNYVPKSQQNNAVVPNTDKQRRMIEKAQKVIYKFNMHTLGLYDALGDESIIDSFGAPDMTTKPTNAQHAKSLEGKRRTIANALIQLKAIRAAAQAHMDEAGLGSLAQVPVHFAYNIIKSGRLQMQGGYNVQNTKLLREVLLSTWSTIDYTAKQDKGYRNFMIGVAQAVGMKVNKVNHDVVIETLTERLTKGNLANIIDSLKGYHQTGSIAPEFLNDLKNALGSDFSFVAMHALSEYARAELSEDQANFETSVYIEADGVTNGVVNAMMMFATGAIGVSDLALMAKGGRFFRGPRTYNQQYAVDSVDLYEHASTKMKSRLANLGQSLSQKPQEKFVFQQVKVLADLFLSDFKMLDEDNFEIKRGLLKNPLTITVYGSGANGMAAKITSLVMEQVYERMTQMAQQLKANPNMGRAQAMFPDAADPEGSYKRFLRSMAVLTTLQVVEGKYGFFIPNAKVLSNQDILAKEQHFNRVDPEKFVLDRGSQTNLTANMKTLFVGPMVDAITDTIGTSLRENVQVLRQATQVMGLVMAEWFNNRVAEVMKGRPNNQGLSQNEKKAIYKEMVEKFPLIKGMDQEFLIGASESTDMNSNEFSRALNGRLKTPGFLYGPSDPGVSGVPLLNIGFGDALMIQLFTNYKNTPDRSLPIFDGINLALDQVELGSVLANKAAFETWQHSPIDPVLEAYKNTIKDADFNQFSEKTIKALTKALGGMTQGITFNTRDAEAITRSLTRISKQIAARQNAFSHLNQSIDQMASAQSPYAYTGEEDMTNATEEQVAQRLTELYHENLGVKPEPKSEASTLKVMKPSTLFKKLKALKLSDTALEMFKRIRLSKAISEYQVVTGSLEEARAWAEANGKDVSQFDKLPKDSKVHGFVSYSGKTIYIFSPKTEVVLHELIHAATFETLVDAIINKSAPQEIKDSVQRIQQLFEQFSGLDMSKEDLKTRLAHAAVMNAVKEILGRSVSDEIKKALILNEFMAWGLANQHLNAKLAATPSLVQLVVTTWQAIKKFFFGSKRVDKPAEDMLSQLRFESTIMVYGTPTVASEVGANVSMMATNYGTDTRLAELQQGFAANIANYVQKANNPYEHVTRQARVSSANLTANKVWDAIQQATTLFKMTPQAEATFKFISAALATQAEIDSQSMLKIQELYTHAVENLKPESFLPEGLKTTDPDYQTYLADASQKLSVILGTNVTQRDQHKRSTLLPTFLGLALVDDGVRAALAKLPMPKKTSIKGATFDDTLRNGANGLLDSLSDRLAGVNSASNVQDAMDRLADRILETANERNTIAEDVLGKTGNLSDTLNSKVQEGMSAFGSKLYEVSDKMKPGVVTASMKTVAGLLDQASANKLAAGLTNWANSLDGWVTFRELMGDLIGRNGSNKNVYDMIKRIKSAVQQVRQQFREDYPTFLSKKFSRKLDEQEWSAITNVVAKSDLASLVQGTNLNTAYDLVTDSTKRLAEITRLEGMLQARDARRFTHVQRKAKQLANYMVTGTYGTNLLRNATAVSLLLNEKSAPGVNKPQGNEFVENLDKLITLYAIENMSKDHLNTVSDLIKNEPEGMKYVLASLVGIKAEEDAKATMRASLNGFKGFTPTMNKQGVSLIVANDADYKNLRIRGYKRVGDYNGSKADVLTEKMGYYYAPISSKSPFNQGIAQNVHQTAYGVAQSSGYITDLSAGRTNDQKDVYNILQEMHREGKTTENLLPVFNEDGDPIAFERGVDPAMLKYLERDTNFARLAGVWLGRQTEERMANEFNHELMQNLADMWKTDKADLGANWRSQYVDLFYDKLDPVVMDAFKLVPRELLSDARTRFADSDGKPHFYVRKDMVNDVFGYRSASVGDSWTGISRFSSSTQTHIKNLLVAAMGNDAYTNVVRAEGEIHDLVKNVKTLIVVKSVVVPVANFVGNLYQLVARGVPIATVVRTMPKKLAEVRAYSKGQLRIMALEAELLAATNDPMKTRQLNTELTTIQDSFKRMSIWPLIQAGEYSSVHDEGISRDDLLLTEGKLQTYMEKLTDKLPPGLQTMGKNLLITKDTALFQGLQKAVEYGDFLAKAVLYEDLTIRGKKSEKEALGVITEEFVNYDRLPGRTRGTLESLGLLWFYNFKIRSVKVALSIIRNNPVQALVSMMLPTPPGMHTVGTVLQDNLLVKGIEGKLGYSIGPGMAIGSWRLNPFANLFF